MDDKEIIDDLAVAVAGFLSPHIPDIAADHDTDQEIIDELVIALSGFLNRHTTPEVTADPDNDPLGPCICGNCVRGRKALAKARGES